LCRWSTVPAAAAPVTNSHWLGENRGRGVRSRARLAGGKKKKAQKGAGASREVVFKRPGARCRIFG